MKYDRIKDMNTEELHNQLEEAEMELIKLNSQVATGTPPENPGKINELKKTVARIKTVLQNE